MSRFLYTIIILLWPFLSAGQYKSLSIGDKLPAITITNIYNHPVSEIQLSSLNDKLVILDFFATWCGACIRELPRLNTLQESLPGNLQIFAVSYEPADKIDAFLKRRANLAIIGLPFITSDSLLKEIFPHHIIPHTVWIYRGRVKAVTGPASVNLQNIMAILKEEPISLPVKKDVFDFDRQKPLLADANGGDEKNILLQSTIISYLPGLPGSSGVTKQAEDGLQRRYYINRPVLALYALAVPEAYGNRILMKVNDMAKFIYAPADWESWCQANAFCYEIRYREGLPDSLLRNRMLRDLNNFFHLSTGMEEHEVDCWILAVNNNDVKKLATAGGKPGIELFDRHSTIKYLHNEPLSKLVEAVNYQIPGRSLVPIVLDETGYNDNVDIEISVRDITDLPALSKELALYGLTLTKGRRKLKLFVIKED